MQRLKRCLILTFVGLSAASCATVGASDGAGYAMLHPSSATREFIFANDKPFTKEVGANNVQCSKDPMCRK